MSAVPPVELVAERVVWSAVFLIFLLPFSGQGRDFIRLWRVPRTIALLVLTAMLIAVNWILFVICATTGHIVEGSLGYFILPLANILLGRIFLKERLSRRQMIACIAAGIGVILFTTAAGRGVVLSVLIAASFAAYGLCRKLVDAEALPGVAVETVLLLPPALFYLGWLQSRHALHFIGVLPMQTAILVAGTGVATVIPLIFYAGAARRLTMSTLGIIFYINPTMQFLLGAVVYGEQMSSLRLIGCGAIWLALILYTTDLKKNQ